MTQTVDATTAMMLFEPGTIVELVGQEDWGHGFVQSVVGALVTVNFEHQGKQVIRADKVPLKIIRAASA
jgi:hypothetical protein